VNRFSIFRVAKLFGNLPSEWHTLNSSRLTVLQYLGIFAIGQLKIEWSTIVLPLAFFRFQMEINELRNGFNLKDPFTAYGSLYGNLNAVVTSAKNNCFRSCISEKNELWSQFGDEHLYATVRISSMGFKADI
jgi:hypothetical protein